MMVQGRSTYFIFNYSHHLFLLVIAGSAHIAPLFLFAHIFTTVLLWVPRERMWRCGFIFKKLSPFLFNFLNCVFVFGVLQGISIKQVLDCFFVFLIFINHVFIYFYCALRRISIKPVLVYSFQEWFLSVFANELLWQNIEIFRAELTEVQQTDCVWITKCIRIMLVLFGSSNLNAFIAVSLYVSQHGNTLKIASSIGSMFPATVSSILKILILVSALKNPCQSLV